MLWQLGLNLFDFVCFAFNILLLGAQGQMSYVLWWVICALKVHCSQYRAFAMSKMVSLFILSLYATLILHTAVWYIKFSTAHSVRTHWHPSPSTYTSTQHWYMTTDIQTTESDHIEFIMTSRQEMREEYSYSVLFVEANNFP